MNGRRRERNAGMIENTIGKLTLSNGVDIPAIGFGTMIDAGSPAVVRAAVRAGFRNFDTAEAYGNEESVGRGIREAVEEGLVGREDLFVSTKLWHTHRSHDMALESFDHSLSRLGLDYVDLYLIHWPAVPMWHDDWRQINADTWSGLEEIYRSGRARAIGVSNYKKSHLEALIEDSDVAPMVDQIEYHPGFGQFEAADSCREHGIVVEAWSPLGGGQILADETIASIAAAHGKTPGQVALRWIIQKGNIVPLPRTTKERRMRESLDVFDFELSPDEMALVDGLEGIGGYEFDPDTAES